MHDQRFQVERLREPQEKSAVGSGERKAEGGNQS